MGIAVLTQVLPAHILLGRHFESVIGVRGWSGIVKSAQSSLESFGHVCSPAEALQSDDPQIRRRSRLVWARAGFRKVTSATDKVTIRLYIHFGNWNYAVLCTQYSVLWCIIN